MNGVSSKKIKDNSTQIWIDLFAWNIKCDNESIGLPFVYPRTLKDTKMPLSAIYGVTGVTYLSFFYERYLFISLFYLDMDQLWQNGFEVAFPLQWLPVFQKCFGFELSQKDSQHGSQKHIKEIRKTPRESENRSGS